MTDSSSFGEEEEDGDINVPPIVILKRQERDAAVEMVRKLNGELEELDQNIERLTRRIEQAKMLLDELSNAWKLVYHDRIRPVIQTFLTLLIALMCFSIYMSADKFKLGFLSICIFLRWFI